MVKDNPRSSAQDVSSITQLYVKPYWSSECHSLWSEAGDVGVAAPATAVCVCAHMHVRERERERDSFVNEPERRLMSFIRVMRLETWLVSLNVGCSLWFPTLFLLKIRANPGTRTRLSDLLSPWLSLVHRPAFLCAPTDYQFIDREDGFGAAFLVSSYHLFSENYDRPLLIHSLQNMCVLTGKPTFHASRSIFQPGGGTHL